MALGMIGSATAAINVLDEKKQAPLIDQAQLKYYFSCGKGFLDGYTKGLYSNNSEGVAKTCMDVDSTNQVISIVNSLQGGDILDIFKHFSVVYQLAYIFDKKCRLQELNFELTTWCVRQECSLTSLGSNFTKNIFSLTGAINEVAQIIFAIAGGQDLDYEDLDEAFDTFLNLGKNIGKMSRVVLNFSKTNSHGMKKWAVYDTSLLCSLIII